MLYLSAMFFTVKIRCPKHIRWRHHHFTFHSQQMTRRDCNFTICIIVSTTKGLELIIASTSVNKVFRDSASKLLLWVLRRDDKMLLADLICLYQTPPVWRAKGGFIFHTIRSAFWLSMNLWILLYSYPR